MDKKKLIGTIIGVMAFAALIAGATFAWFTATVTINNGSYTGTAKNFVFTFAGSANIGNNLAIIDSTTSTTSNITSSASAAVANDGWAAITASKTANDAPAKSFKLLLNITTNTLTTNSLVYAVCKGDCPTTALVTAVSTSGTNHTATCGSGVASCGVIAKGSTSAVTLYDDTSTFNVTSAKSQIYNVYFWLDGPAISNNDMNKQFAAKINASAEQINS